jgi:hypothetical protein
MYVLGTATWKMESTKEVRESLFWVSNDLSQIHRLSDIEYVKTMFKIFRYQCLITLFFMLKKNDLNIEL